MSMSGRLCACLHMVLVCSPLASAVAGEDAATLYTWHPRTWYADMLTGPAAVSHDGAHAVLYTEGGWQLVALETGEARDLAAMLDLDPIWSAAWSSRGLVACGRKGETRFTRVLDPRTGEQHDLDLPGRVGAPLLDGSGRVVAMTGRIDDQWGLWNLRDGEPPQRLADMPLGLAVSPDGARLAWISTDGEGRGELWVAHCASGEVARAAAGLDVAYQHTGIEWTSDSRRVLLSLASEGASLEDKHRPDSDRDLDIYALDPDTQKLERIVSTDDDDLVSAVWNDVLYWTRQSTDMHAAIVAIDQGTYTPMTDGTSSYPFWRPDGRALSVMYGAWHLADWALNWDLGVVELDGESGVSSQGGTAAAIRPVITGWHEDFGLSWSPDGTWMAYHSHRSPTPVASYRAEGATDDIYLRRAAGGPEIRVTEKVGFEVAQPDWAPDGRRLAFTAIRPGAGYRAFVSTIDPDTGAPVSTEMLRLTGPDGDIVGVAWSQARAELAIEESTGAGSRRLWRVADGDSTAHLVAAYRAVPELGGVDFFPDGEWIAYAALDGQHHQVFRVRRDGGDPEQITDLDRECYVPQVSPDGQRVAVTVYRHTKTLMSRGM